MNEYQVTFASSFEEADKKAMEITDCLKTFYGDRLDSGLEFNLNFVIRELLNNAVEHGNEFNEEKHVHCHMVYDDESVVIEVTDQGDGIKPEKRLLILEQAGGRPLQMRQRGLWLVEKLGFTLELDHNTVRAIYYWRVKE